MSLEKQDRKVEESGTGEIKILYNRCIAWLLLSHGAVSTTKSDLQISTSVTAILSISEMISRSERSPLRGLTEATEIGS